MSKNKKATTPQVGPPNKEFVEGLLSESNKADVGEIKRTSDGGHQVTVILTFPPGKGQKK
jgi:hypothetical protein